MHKTKKKKLRHNLELLQKNITFILYSDNILFDRYSKRIETKPK